jgi:hypothetical protein
MNTSTGLSRLEIYCGRSASHPPLSEELFSLSPPVLPGSAHEIEEVMNAADKKRHLHQVMFARQLLNASLRAQVSGRPPSPTQRRLVPVLAYMCRALSEWLARPVLCAAKDETSVEFMRPLLNSGAECSVVISC